MENHIHSYIVSFCVMIVASNCYSFDRCLYRDGYTVNGLEIKQGGLRFICSDSLAIEDVLQSHPSIGNDGGICYAHMGKSIHTRHEIRYALESDRILKLCTSSERCIRVFVSSIDSIKCEKAVDSPAKANRSNTKKTHDLNSINPEDVALLAVSFVAISGLIYIISNSGRQWRMPDP